MSDSLLNNIVNDKEPSSLVVIHDTYLHRGRALLSAFIQTQTRGHLQSSSTEAIVAVLSDQLPSAFVKNFPSTSITTIDAFNLCASGAEHAAATMTSKIYNAVISSIQGKENVLVVLDSLVLILGNDSGSNCAILLRELMEAANIRRVVVVLHADLVNSQTRISVNHLATTSIALRPLSPSESTGGLYQGACSVYHRRKSGKILQSNEWYSLDAALLLLTSPAIKPVSAEPLPEATEAPLDSLTFNALTINAEQKRAKDAVALPYTMTPLQKKKELQRATSTSRIAYEPDAADDIDVEDPDEDLDY